MSTETTICPEILATEYLEVPPSLPITKHFVIKLRSGEIAWEGDAETIIDALVGAFTRREECDKPDSLDPYWDHDELDFTGCDLTGIPIVPSIDRSILDAINRGGTLNMGAWHGNDEDETNTKPRRCGTTHCRAGWATYMAGAAGFALEDELERRLDPLTDYYESLAGALIYAASRPGRDYPDFYAEDHEAMADLRACAAGETL